MAIVVINQPVFQRAMRVIASITNASPAVVTTTTDHQYLDGMMVRLNIPIGFGMQQVNQQQGLISIINDTSFSIALDTTMMDPFLALINLGTTDGSGDLSGTVSATVPLSIGQSFSVGSQIFIVVADSGALYCSGSGSGTFDVSTGNFTITGGPASTTVYFNQALYPASMQYAQVTPIGVTDSSLAAATQNVLGTGFYN